MRVLLIEDNSASARSIELMLKPDGFNVHRTDLGEEGVELGQAYDYDIVLLDLTLPDISGFDVIRSLRVSNVSSPILIISGHNVIDDKIKALRTGADDYVTKPFHKDELIARISALVRRSRGYADPLVEIDGLLINLQTKAVEVHGTRLHVTRKEYKILELLALRVGKVVSKEMFLDHLYGGLEEPDDKILDVFICKLRKKLECASEGKKYIGTEWGRGYFLCGSQENADERPNLSVPAPGARSISSGLHA
jgi:two-component system cell cycle response regulator CtrA